MASEERAQLGHVAHHDVHAFGQFGDSFQQFLNQTNESQHKGLLQDVYMGFVTAGLRTLLLKESSTIQVGGRPGWGGRGTPYIRMIGMIVVFLGAIIGDLVFFRGCSCKVLQRDKTGIC